MGAGTDGAIALCRQEFEQLVVQQLEAYTEKPAEVQDLRNACRYPSPLLFGLTVQVLVPVALRCLACWCQNCQKADDFTSNASAHLPNQT